MKKLVAALAALATFNAFADDVRVLGHFDMENGNQLLAYQQSCGIAAEGLAGSQLGRDPRAQSTIRFLRQYPDMVRAALIAPSGNVVMFACLEPNGPSVHVHYSDGDERFYQKRNFIVDIPQ